MLIGNREVIIVKGSSAIDEDEIARTLAHLITNGDARKYLEDCMEEGEKAS